MKLALLSLVGLSLLGQSATAVYTDFNPTVKRVTIGTTQCTVWFHGSVAAPYDSEVACYQNGKAVLVQAGLPGVAMFGSFVFTGGSVGWVFKPNDTDKTKIDYQITGQGSTDAVPLLKIGTV